jgi:hypothetical protein
MKYRLTDKKRYRAICPLGHWQGTVQSDIVQRAINVRCPHCATALKLMPISTKKPRKDDK